MERLDIYQTVTNTIIEAMEKGLTGGFELPWHSATSLPKNAKTGNSYHGVNVPLLWAHQLKAGYQSSTWATYRQWQDLGAQVLKGEKGAQIVFWGAIEVEPENHNQEAQTCMFARYSTVFNVNQVEGVSPLPYSQPSEIESIAAADMLIDASGAVIKHEENSAFYCMLGDYINVPYPTSFRETEGSTATANYYSTLFHELTHWSGAAHRLDRKNPSKFGDADYAFEELVAELGAAFLCALTGVTSSPRQDHAKYIESWLQALKKDKKFIFSAASQAQKAADFLFSFQSKQEAA